MMLKRFIRATVLNEGRYEIALERYPQFKKELALFKKEDPSENLKYLLWQVKQLVRGERADEIVSLVKQFHAQNVKLKEKDINRYETLTDLRAAFEALSKREEGRFSKADAEKVYEDERYVVIHPKTEEASRKYGAKWCISARESENYFYQYLTQVNGVFYFIIDRARKQYDAARPNEQSDPLSKLALLYSRDEQYNATLFNVTDADNNELTNNQAFSSIENIETLNKIKAAINRHLQSKPKIEYVEKIKRAQDVNSSAEVLATLAKDKDDVIRQYVALNTSTPAEVLATLARDKNIDIRYDVALNTSTPAETLNTLAKDKDDVIRQCVALNTSTPAETLASLTTSHDKHIRQNLARNTSTSAETLASLATSSDSNVKENVARNTSTSAETLVLLSTDNNKWIRVAVAVNTNTPAETLASLARDNNPWVRVGVAGNTNTPAETLASLATLYDERIRVAVAVNTSTPVDVLASLARDNSLWVRVGIAKNENTPAGALASLATSYDERIRQNVAENKNTPTDVLTQLATKDQNVHVRLKAEENLRRRVNKVNENKNILKEFINNIVL